MANVYLQTLKQFKLRLESENRKPIVQIIRVPTVKEGQYLISGFLTRCPECDCKIDKGTLFVPSDSIDIFVEAVTLWPDALIVNPPKGWPVK